MKRKLLSFVLSAAMVLSLIPPTKVSAAGTAGVPDDFMKSVTLPLMPAADGELYDKVEGGLPDPSESGFIAEVEGGEPAMPSSGLMAEVGEAPAGATEIGTAEQLQAMTKGTYVLTADIDLTGVAWTPINLSTKGSNVVLDGQGHTIKGLTVNATTEANYGLFSYVYGDVTVKNLRMDDVTLNLAVTEESSTSQYGVGALFGSVKGTVTLDNVAADISIARTGAYICKIGGLVGMSSSTATVADVAVQASMPEADDALVGIAHYPSIGGIAGELTGACSFTRCYAAVNLHTTNWGYNKAYGMGGMAGYIGNGHKVTSFTDCMVEGTLVSADHRAGGLVGGTPGGLSLNNCVVEADMTGREVGGYCAYLQNFNTDSSCVDCRYTGKLTLNTIRESYGGGFFGQGTAKMTNCAADVTVDAVKATSKTCYIGGFMGDGGGTIQNCALDVMMGDFSGTNLLLGGVAGDGKTKVTNTLVDLDAFQLKNAAGAIHVGGLLGGEYGASLTAQNCGATVNINVAVPGEAAEIILAGMSAEAEGSFVKCWADGAIYLSNPGSTGTNYYLGGLAGYRMGSMSQCYGGVDISYTYFPNSNQAYGMVGGLSGRSGSMYSCWSDAAISSDSKTRNDCVGGLCGASNGSTYRDCTFTGELKGMNATYVGGLLAECQTGYFYNCYVDGELESGLRIGGLLGHASHATVFTDCSFEGSVTALKGGGAGGLISAADDVLNGTATLRRCEVNADITAPDGTAYGMGSSVKAYDCEFRGDLSGARMGGIGSGGSIYDCSVTADFEVNGSIDDIVKVGGIASGPSVVSGCTMNSHIYLDVELPKDEVSDSVTVKVGGISAEGGKIVDCTSNGVTVHGSGGVKSDADDTEANDSIRIHAGGITGLSPNGMKNCRVQGSVSAWTTRGVVYAGGLCGDGSCTVDGCVAGSASAHTGYGSAYAGGLFGAGSDKLYLNYCSGGSGYAYSADGNAYMKHPWVGNDKYDSGGKTLKIPKRPDESYTILTFEYPDVTETANSTIVPLGGVTIREGKNTLGKTNAAGMLTITREQAGSLNMKITGSKDGYFSDDSGATLAGGGSTSLYLMKKTDGKIYLTSALYTRQETQAQSEKTMDLLSDPNTVVIPQFSTAPQQFFFGVDWNGAREKGRVLQLNNEAGNHPLPLVPNESRYLEIQEHFKPDEDIYLEAKASFGDTEVTERVKLKLKVKEIKPELKPEAGEIQMGGENGMYFLDGVNFKLDLEDLTKYGGDFSFENGLFTAKFYTKEEDPSERQIAMFNQDKINVSLGGEIKIPYSEEGKGQWSGAVFAAWNRELEAKGEGDEKESKTTEKEQTQKDKKETGDVFEWIYNHIFPPAIPLEFKVSFGAGAGGKLGIQGEFEKAEFFGTSDADGTVTAFIGLGKTFNEDYEVTGGGEGTMKLSAAMTHTVDQPVDFDPALEGSLAAKFTAKAGEILDLGLELKLGGFKWNRDGVVWYAGDEPIWEASERAYLAQGGGFAAEEIYPISSLASLNSWLNGNKQTGGRAVLYENIHADSRAAMAMENGVPVLYFTADDAAAGSDGLVAEHTSLWRTKYTDSGWSTPECVSGSEHGYPAVPDADGDYVVWVESPETDGLDALLTSTDLKIAHNGEVIHTIDGNGYVYAPEITADTNGNILVVWLADSEVDGTAFIPTAQTLQYAKYDAAAAVWSAGAAATTAIPVSTALTSGDTTCIYTSDAEGTLYRVSGDTFGSCTEYLGGLARFGTIGTHTASIGEDGVLTIWDGTTQAASLELNTTIVSQPILRQSGEGTYVIWAQSDGVYYADSTDSCSSIKKVCDETGLATRLTAEIVDGRPLVSYYRSVSADDTVTTNLISAWAEDISGTDLVLSDLKLDSRDLGELGIVRILGEVTNRMKTAQTGYAYTVTDETGAEIISDTVTLDEELTLGETDRLCILVGHDVTAQHTYTVTVTPLTGTDVSNSDNAMAVTACAESALAGTSFRKTHEGVVLEALVKNIGAAPEENLTVEVYRADLSGAAVGKALLSEEINGLLPGSYRQILLNNTESDVYYKVVLLNGEEELGSEMLMWSDPEVSGIWVQNVDVEQSGTSCVTLLARGMEEDVQLHLALYQGGKMVANAMKKVSAWDGSKEIELNLDELSAGEYTYAVYLLRQSDLAPVTAKYSESIRIN